VSERARKKRNCATDFKRIGGERGEGAQRRDPDKQKHHSPCTEQMCSPEYRGIPTKDSKLHREGPDGTQAKRGLVSLFSTGLRDGDKHRSKKQLIKLLRANRKKGGKDPGGGIKEEIAGARRPKVRDTHAARSQDGERGFLYYKGRDAVISDMTCTSYLAGSADAENDTQTRKGLLNGEKKK